jgi:hypothetical protein
MGQSPMFSNNFDEDAIAIIDMFIETSLLQYYDNNDDIYDDGIKMNELLLVLGIIYSLMNKANHVKVEAHMDSPIPLTSLSIPQFPIYKIENNQKQHCNIHA